VLKRSLIAYTSGAGSSREAVGAAETLLTIAADPGTLVLLSASLPCCTPGNCGQRIAPQIRGSVRMVARRSNVARRRLATTYAPVGNVVPKHISLLITLFRLELCR
jgi:hypothetical protein